MITVLSVAHLGEGLVAPSVKTLIAAAPQIGIGRFRVGATWLSVPLGPSPVPTFWSEGDSGWAGERPQSAYGTAPEAQGGLLVRRASGETAGAGESKQSLARFISQRGTPAALQVQDVLVLAGCIRLSSPRQVQGPRSATTTEFTSARMPTVLLRNGSEIPVIGLGTWPLRGAESTAQVRTAIEAGYRLIDTAANYRNEDSVGQGIRDSGIERSEIFVTTKFDREWHSVDGVRRACEASVKQLGIDYLDLLMVHWPNPCNGQYVDAMRGLQALLDDGEIRAIGTSNFKPRHLQRVLDEAGIVPDVNQIELSPYATRDASRAYHVTHGVVTESWTPLGGSRTPELRQDPVIKAIADAHGRSATQVVLRWHLQLGVVAIPRSSNPVRIAENFDLFDFELSEREMSTISALDRGEAGILDSDVFGH
jgi:2,5-diketo-D-gluconate reductase A